MATAAITACRVQGCSENVPSTLGREQLCLTHFLEQTLARSQQALEHCQKGEPLEGETLEWFFDDAQYLVLWLSRNAEKHQNPVREKMLEVMLCLSNLNHYLRHHSVS